jgi:hypothetical protein
MNIHLLMHQYEQFILQMRRQLLVFVLILSYSGTYIYKNVSKMQQRKNF